ncbi:DNA topoisomerase IV subunit B [Methylobacillus sp. Pita2]|uniref:DNA topoisomerase IV subunit B n=1 Tax=Methylobacillus sp. Pita2 TaxID=3383245 RepID=UPI0038B6005D
MTTTPNKQAGTYSAEDVRVLRGLEPVRKRPGMYTRTDSPTHIVQEVLDNASDEALGGYATNVLLTMYNDGSVEIQDNGRGIPVDTSSVEDKPAIELIFTELHSGGKFGDGAYSISGGLHGVGVSVTNALSTKLEAEVRRGGQVHYIAFKDGEVVTPLSVKSRCNKSDTGTRVRCWPDPKYFDSAEVSVKTLEHLVRSKAVMLPGVELEMRIENSAREIEAGAERFTVKSWKFPGGMKQYLEESLVNEETEEDVKPVPIITGSLFTEQGEGGEWAIAFRPEAGGKGESYVNLIPTLNGGTHVTGMRNGVLEAVRSFAEHHAMMPNKIKLSHEDVWGNLHFFLSSKVLEPQFQGQTKETLTNRETHKVMTSTVAPILEAWMNQNPDFGKRITEMAIRSANTRTKAMVKVEKKKSSGMSVLPDKLTDCELSGTMEAEIFLVEGDSAGGSAKMARDRERQAILPMKGKIKNTWLSETATVLGFAEVHDIFVALGIEPHRDGQPADLSGLRYGKINILADADIDGSHIQVLVLGMFLRHAPQLIDRGHVHIAIPPLFRIDVPARGKSKPEQKIYASDERELNSIVDRLAKEGVAYEKLIIQRFKGLGEMNPDQLWETTLSPDTRRLAKVVMTEKDKEKTLRIFDMLMDKNESEQRRNWMEARGHLVEADI